MRSRSLISVFALLPAIAHAQTFTFGAIGGVPAQTPLGQTDSRMPFALGAAVDVRIFSRLSFETGIVFHRLGQEANTATLRYPDNILTIIFRTEGGRAIELPFLAKYYLRGEHKDWRPFVTAGPAVRRTSLNTRYVSSVLSDSPLPTYAPPPLLSGKTVQWTVDPVFGVGVDFKTGRFHIEPEARYSYWGAGKESMVWKSQVQFLLGFRF